MAQEADRDLRHLGQAFTGPELERRRAEAWRRAVERLVDRSLLNQASGEAGIKVTEDELRDQLQRHMTRLGIATETQLDLRLREEGSTLPLFREDLRVQILVQRYMDRAVRPPPPPSPEEILRYYADHVAEFAKPQEVQLRQIVIDKRRFPAREDAEALVREVWTALKAHADFAELARKHSHSPSAQDGGLFPYMPIASLRGDLQEAVERLASGGGYAVDDTLSVHETADAFILLRVEGVRHGEPRPPAEVQDLILERLRRDDMDRRRARILQLLRKNAYLWIADGAP